MALYTKNGDGGMTHRPNGLEVRKCDSQLEAGGAIDELNASIGWCLAAAEQPKHAEFRQALLPVPSELFSLGALLAAAGTEKTPEVTLNVSAVKRMENLIDAVWKHVGSLEHFLQPRGCELACRLHLTRTICRRAERRLAAAVEAETRIPRICCQYLNRLGDLLFTLARLANKAENIPEQIWPTGE